MKPLTLPEGTTANIKRRVEYTERKLGLTRTKYQDNPWYWGKAVPPPELTDTQYCTTVRLHNSDVRQFYHLLAKCSAKTPPSERTEVLTPEAAADFWPGLLILDVPLERWDRDHYQNRIEHLYDVLRGVKSEGVTLSTKALTPQQACAVISLFGGVFASGFDNELRPEVPKGYDRLFFSHTGDYEWCSHCGAIATDDVRERIAKCRKKCGGMGCELKREVGESYE
jgi:hypothetical protein